MEGALSAEATMKIVEEHWDSWFVKSLSDFIRVPNLSQMHDSEYLKNGLVEKAIQIVDDSQKILGLEGMQRHVIQPEGKPPLVVYVIEGEGKNIMFYGHLDKQPHLTGWDEGLGHIDPVIKNGNLYGRGGADDGYASFAAFMAVKVC